MPCELYQDVILTTDIPAHGLCIGDVGTVVERHVVPGREDDYGVEFFDMTGRTVAVATVPISWLRTPTPADRPSTWTLAAIAGSVELPVGRTIPTPEAIALWLSMVAITLFLFCQTLGIAACKARLMPVSLRFQPINPRSLIACGAMVASRDRLRHEHRTFAIGNPTQPVSAEDITPVSATRCRRR